MIVTSLNKPLSGQYLSHSIEKFSKGAIKFSDNYLEFTIDQISALASQLSL